MFAPSAIRALLEKDVDSWNWMKRVPVRQLSRQLRGLPIDLDFAFKPMKHQMVAILLGIENPKFTFHLDMGLGKTFCSLYVAKYRMLMGQVDRTLVVVPNTANVEGWREEVAKFTDYKMVGLTGTKAKRFKEFEKDFDICVINYHGLQTMMTEMVKNKQGKGQRQSVEAMAEKFIEPFDMVVFDEAHLFKNRESLTSHLCELIAHNVDYKYALTGTPMKEPKDLWNQFHIIDEGETFGHSYELFEEAFYREKATSIGTELVFNERRRRTLTKLMRHRSIYYKDTECSDLPKRSDIPLPMVLSSEAEKHYKRAMKGLIEADGNKQEVKNSYNKLRQITSGYLHIKNVDEDTGEVDEVFIDFPDNPKMDMLLQLVDEMPHDSKMIVFHKYQHTGELISEALKKAKINHRCLNGRTKNKEKAVKDFKTDDTVHVLVANEITGSTGHNFQVATRTYFFESPQSPIIRSQAEKRTHRTGQTKPCFVYDPICRGTIDEKIQLGVAANKDLFEMVMEGSTAEGFLY